MSINENALYYTLVFIVGPNYEILNYSGSETEGLGPTEEEFCNSLLAPIHKEYAHKYSYGGFSTLTHSLRCTWCPD